MAKLNYSILIDAKTLGLESIKKLEKSLDGLGAAITGKSKAQAESSKAAVAAAGIEATATEKASAKKLNAIEKEQRAKAAAAIKEAQQARVRERTLAKESADYERFINKQLQLNNKAAAGKGGGFIANQRQAFRQSLGAPSPVAGAVGTAAAVAGGAKVLGDVKTLDTLNLRASALAGSLEGGNKLLNQAAALADKYGQSFRGVASSALDLKAQLDALNISQETQLATLEGLSIINARSGGDENSLKFGILGANQALGKGILNAEEYNQIVENLKVDAQLFADAIGVPVEKVKETIETGRVDATQALTRLALLATDRYGKIAEEVGNGLAGTIQRIQNSYDKAILNLNKGGASAGIKEGIDSVANAFGGGEDLDANYKALGKAIGDAGRALGDAIAKVIRFTKENKELVSAALELGKWVLILKAGLGTLNLLISPVRQLGVLFGGVALAGEGIAKVFTIFQSLTTAAINLNNKLGLTLGSLARIAAVGGTALAVGAEISNTLDAKAALKSTQSASDQQKLSVQDIDKKIAVLKQEADSTKLAIVNGVGKIFGGPDVKKTIDDRIAQLENTKRIKLKEAEQAEARKAKELATIPAAPGVALPSVEGVLRPEKAKKGTGGGGAAKVKDQGEAIARETADKINAIAELAADESRRLAEQQLDTLEASLAKQLISYDAYLDARAAAEKASIAGDIKLQETRIAGIKARLEEAAKRGDAPDVLNLEAELARAEGTLADIAARGVSIETRLDIDRAQFAKDVKDLGNELRNNILSLSGDNKGAQLATLAIEKQKLLEDDRVRGNQELIQLIEQQTALKEQQIEVENELREIERSRGFLAAVQKENEQKRKLGKLTAIEAEKIERAAVEQTIGAIQGKLAALETISAANGSNTELKEQIRDLKLELTDLEIQANKTAIEFNQAFGTEVKQALKDVVQGTQSATDAARRLISVFFEKTADRALDGLVDKAFGGSTGGLGAIFAKFDPSQFFGIGQQAGGNFAQGFGGMLDGLFGLIKSLGSAIGGGFGSFLGGIIPGFATGGQVQGPGTGTSDSILAKLSNGEFVVRAAAVRQIGAPNLDFLNRFGRLPAFNTGGIVGDAPAGGGTGGAVRIVNVIDSGMVADAMNSSQGERVILNAIRKNSAAVKQSIR